MKKLVSGLTALTLTISAFSGMTSYAAVANQYTPTTTETFDGQMNSINMDTPWLTQSYVLKEGSDYWWNVRFPKNDNGLYGRTGDIITSDANEYYLEFDFSTDVCDNFSIAPAATDGTAADLSLSMSRNGYMIGTNLKPSSLGLANDKSVLENARATVEANKNSWMNCSDTKDYAAGQTYNIRYVFNKTENTIDLYANDVLLRSKTVTNVTDYTRLMIYAHYSGSSNAEKNFRLDNVEVGTVSKITVPGAAVNVSSATLSANGVLTIEFDADVDENSLTAETVKVLRNNAAVSYTNASYDSETKTWTATISNFDVFNDCTVKMQGAKGTDDNFVVDFEKTFAGKDFVLTPVLDENFDDGDIDNTNWGNQYLTETFDEVTGRGKVWTIPFGAGMAASSVNGTLGGLSQYMTGDVNYIKFNFKTENPYNFTFTPLPADTYTAYLNFSTSRNGWMYANKFTTVNQAGLSGDQSVLDNNSKAIISDASWRNGGEVNDFAAGTWYTLTYIFDKTHGKMKLYLNDEFQYEVSVSADVLGSIDRLFIWNHNSSVDSTTSRHMSFDNFEVGTVSNSITVESAERVNDEITLTFSEAVNANSINSDTVKITENDSSVAYTGSYNAETNVYTCKITKANPYVAYKVSVKDVVNESGKTIKNFEKTFNGINYFFTSGLNDTFDDATSTLSWKPGWCPDVEYTDEAGRGKVAAVKYATKSATTDTTINLPVGQYLTQAGAVKYISFDVKTPVLRNLAFSLKDDTGNYYPVSFLISEKGWAMGRHVVPSYSADAELIKNYFANTKATLESWGINTFGDYKAGDWHNVKFILDTVNEKINVLLDDKVICSYGTTAEEQATITKLMVLNCSEETDNTVNVMYIDNFQVGTARPETSDVILVNSKNEQILNGQNVSVAYSSAVIKNTSDKEITTQVSCAAYGSLGEMIDVKVTPVKVGAGQTVIVSAKDCEGLNTTGAVTLRAFVWSGWDTLTPLAPNDEVTVSVGETVAN